MESTSAKANKKRHEQIPYVFNSILDAEKAVKAIEKKYAGQLDSYNIGKTIFVRKHTSLIMNFDVLDFVRNLGGTEAGGTSVG